MAECPICAAEIELADDAMAGELLVCDDLSAALDVRAERSLWDRIWARGLLRPGRTCGSVCLAVSFRRPALRRAHLATRSR